MLTIILRVYFKIDTGINGHLMCQVHDLMYILNFGLLIKHLFTVHLPLYHGLFIFFSTFSHSVLFFVYIFLSGYLELWISISHSGLCPFPNIFPPFQCFLLSITLSQLIGTWAVKIVLKDQY